MKEPALKANAKEKGNTHMCLHVCVLYTYQMHILSMHIASGFFCIALYVYYAHFMCILECTQAMCIGYSVMHLLCAFYVHNLYVHYFCL